MLNVEKVRSLRESKGLTQKALGEFIGIKPNSMSEIESGKKGLYQDKWPALAKALGVRVSDLLTDAPEDTIVIRLLAAFSLLSADSRHAVLDHAEALAGMIKSGEA